jgi:hypothetical protein
MPPLFFFRPFPELPALHTLSYFILLALLPPPLSSMSSLPSSPSLLQVEAQWLDLRRATPIPCISTAPMGKLAPPLYQCSTSEGCGELYMVRIRLSTTPPELVTSEQPRPTIHYGRLCYQRRVPGGLLRQHRPGYCYLLGHRRQVPEREAGLRLRRPQRPGRHCGCPATGPAPGLLSISKKESGWMLGARREHTAAHVQVVHIKGMSTVIKAGQLQEVWARQLPARVSRQMLKEPDDGLIQESTN